MSATVFDVSQFTTDGITSPLRILKPAQTQSLQRQYRAFVERTSEHPDQDIRVKPHLVSTWLDGIVRNPALVNILESILGEHIVLWESDFHTSGAGVRSVVHWHQDLPLWDLSGDAMVNVLLAVTPVTKDRGPRLVLPASHTGVLDLRAAPEHPSRIELEPGDVCIHHGNLAWATEPDHCDDETVVFVMRYMSADMFSRTGMDSVTYIKGDLKHNEFEFEPRVQEDFDYSALKALERALSFPSGLSCDHQTQM